MHIARSLLELQILLCLVSTPQLFAQNNGATALQEVGKVKVPSEYRVVDLAHCDFKGRLYAGFRFVASSKTGVLRFETDFVNTHQVSITAFTDSPRQLVGDIHEFAPDNEGGIFAIAVETKTRSHTIVHFDNEGKLTGVLPINGLSPKKLAVFANGNLLIGGFSLGSARAWQMSIFGPDGTLIRNVSLEPRALLPGHFKPPYDWDMIAQQLDFRPSRDENIYVVLPGSTTFGTFGAESRLAAISSGGDITYHEIPGPHGELFSLAISSSRVFALFGTRNPADHRTGKFDDLREFAMDTATHELHPLGHYKVLGKPACLADDMLLVVRPDGQGPGAVSLVAYALP